MQLFTVVFSVILILNRESQFLMVEKPGVPGLNHRLTTSHCEHAHAPRSVFLPFLPGGTSKNCHKLGFCRSNMAEKVTKIKIPNFKFNFLCEIAESIMRKAIIGVSIFYGS